MKPASGFRIAAAIVSVLTIVYATGSLVAETVFPVQPEVPVDPAQIVTQQIAPVAGWAAFVSPLRTDLEANYATAVAFKALRPAKTALSVSELQANQHAEDEVKRVLRAVPYNSTLWLMLAILHTQRGSDSRLTIEALKMSYFTAPNDAQLMPLRLYTAAASDSLSDLDLKELAVGDVRLMLLRKPDMKGPVLTAYRNGSAIGRVFLENAAQSIDPQFASALH